MLSSLALDIRLGYAGYQWDQPLSTYHARHRVYDPFAGRWLNRDPIEYDGGTMNLYEFNLSNPMYYIDRFGLDLGVLPGHDKESDNIRRHGTNPLTGTPIHQKPRPTFTRLPKTIPQAFGMGIVEGFYCWCEGFVNSISFGLIPVDVSPYLYDPRNPDYKTSRVTSRISCDCVLADMGCKSTGASAEFAIHPPHAGGPHQYYHFQLNWWRKGIINSDGVFRIRLWF